MRTAVEKISVDPRVHGIDRMVGATSSAAVSSGAYRRLTAVLAPS